MKRITSKLKKEKRKLILSSLFIFLGVIWGMKLTQHQLPEGIVDTLPTVERRLLKVLPISFMQAKPESGLHSFTQPMPHLETMSLSNDGGKLALWLEPYRWEGRFSVMNTKGDEEVIKNLSNFSLEILFPSYFFEAGDPLHISWSPDDSEIAFSVRKVDIEESDEEGGTFKKWMTVIFNSKDKSFREIKFYTVVNILNPWGTFSDKGILLKKEEGNELFSLALFSPSAQETLWSFTPQNFRIRADEVIARRDGKIYVFEQDLKGRAKVWTIDISTKKEQIYLDLQLDRRFRYYSMPSPNLEFFLLIGVPEKYPEKLSGPKTFFEVRELSTGKLIKRLSVKDYWLHFLRWSSDCGKVALLGFNRFNGWLGIWDIGKDKLYQLPTGQWETISADFGKPSSKLYILSRENVKECKIYIVDIPE